MQIFIQLVIQELSGNCSKYKLVILTTQWLATSIAYFQNNINLSLHVVVRCVFGTYIHDSSSLQWLRQRKAGGGGGGGA